jgi:hypothetical protein
VLRKRGAETTGRRRTGAGGGAPRDDDGIPVAGVPEDSGEVARKLPRDDVVLVGLRRDRAAAELELTGAVVWAAHVRENEIGRVYELQWVAAVLSEH